ncbi:MAG: cytidylate kinase [Promethearchaeota archaeon]|nr:MAG: cytidylate kinase [Candidatus Lokiarchaeota archaeon]
MILTISGLHGTGKSTIGKLLAETLGLRYYSTGQAFRDLAQEMNMTLEEFTEYVEKHPEIDKKLDQRVIQVAKEGNILVDSQLSGFLLKSIADLKIHLTCPLETRVKRIAERDNNSYEESLKETLLREKSELDRFKNLYNIDISDSQVANHIYDLIVDTEKLSVEQVLEKLLHFIKNANI